MKVRFSRRARNDLRRIFRDLASQSSPKIANQVLDRVVGRCATLDQFPERGLRFDKPRLDHLRRIFETPYVVVYQTAGSEVQIVAVLHERRDVESRLSRLRSSAPT